VAPAPLGAVLIDFELARQKKDLPAKEWDKLVKADFTELLKEAVYLQCALGRQPGPMGEHAMARIAELFPSPGRFERHIRRQAAV